MQVPSGQCKPSSKSPSSSFSSQHLPSQVLALRPASVAAFLAKVVTCKVILDVNLSFLHAIEELA
jgi:hypothetical protein